jgi:dipeptidase
MMKFDPDAAFWVFNQVSNLAYTRYDYMLPYIQEKQNMLEKGYREEIKAVDDKALILYKQNPSKAIQYITDYSIKSGEKTVAEWKNLYGFLFARYLDGNVKTPAKGQKNPKVEQPGYDESWYRQVVKDAGERLSVPQESAH